MLVMPNGRFISQRQLPRMALINTALNQKSGTLTLSLDGFGSVSLGFHPQGQSTISAQVWRDHVDVQEASQEASIWLTAALNSPQPLRLVSMHKDAVRQHCNPERFGTASNTYFADAAPALITNTASLSHLNHQLSARQLPEVDIRRFRPNIVVSGLAPFEEQALNKQLLTHRDYRLRLVDQCERCIITTINPDSAEKHPKLEPFRTLGELNPMPGTSPETTNRPAFGMNSLIEVNKATSISVGDVLQQASPFE